MSKFPQLLLAVAAASCLAAPLAAQAGEPRSTACTVSIQMKQGAVSTALPRLAYEQSFTVVDGASFYDDFSSVTRIREFAVTAAPGANKAATLSFALYADVGVFDWIDFRTELDVSRDDAPVVSRGSSSYGNTTQGDHFTHWTITCQRVKN